MHTKPESDNIRDFFGAKKLYFKILLDDPSSVSLFFRSLLPNFNPDEPLPPLEEGAEGGVVLRNSVQSLVGALRELYRNIEVFFLL